MKPVSSKRLLRIERKKKKMAALLEISKLNEYDHAAKCSQMTVTDSIVDPYPMVTEPSAKRLRTDDTIETEDKDSEQVTRLTNKPLLLGEEYFKLKTLLREKSKIMRAQPNFRLREMGETAEFKTNTENRLPLFLYDIQHLLMYSQIGHYSPYSPARWCQLEKYTKLSHTNVLIIENISAHHYLAHENCFPFLNSTFTNKLEVITPCSYNGDIVQDLALVPLTNTQIRKFISQYGTLEAALSQSPDLFNIVKNMFPVNVNSELSGGDVLRDKSDKFPRTHLLLSGWQMVEENFPLPIKGLMETKYKDYKLTKDLYKDATSSSPMFGMDCEMCRTTSGDLELTRISIVDENLGVFYEQLVKPHNKIIDYLTKYSGITAKMMKNVTKRLHEVQNDLRSLLPDDAILVGQSLSNDLHAVKMMHPYIIDTSVIYNVTGDRSRKTKLQTLSREFLSEKIQEGNRGHCSVEDSLACMKLVQLKLSRDLFFGDAVMSNVQSHMQKCVQLEDPNYAISFFKQTTKMERTVSVVGLSDIVTKYHFYTNKGFDVSEEKKKINFVTEKCNKSVIKRCCEYSMQYSMNIAHLRVTDVQLDRENLKPYKSVDKWIKEFYEHTAMPGMCVVLFAGQKEAGNGCCFIQLKKLTA